MAQTEKVLVRDSDGRAEGYNGMDDPWEAPAAWTTKLAAGYSALSIPAGPNKPLIDDAGYGVFIWKIVTGAWVARDQVDIDADKVVTSQAWRDNALTGLQQQRTAAQALADDVGLPQAVRDAQAAKVTALDAKITTHGDEYGNIWVLGTNP